MLFQEWNFLPNPVIQTSPHIIIARYCDWAKEQVTKDNYLFGPEKCY
jgi:hypothetical protein